MKCFTVIVVIMFFGALNCSAQEEVPAVEPMTLIVEVANGTVNGKAVSGDRVQVDIYEHKKQVDRLEGIAGADGTATFENIRGGEHLVAYGKAFHEGMSFSSHAVTLKPGEQRVRVKVFDVSYDDSSLSVVTHHLMAKQKDNSLAVSEFVQLRNSSDMAVTSQARDGENRAIVITIPLPKGYKDFTSSGYLVPAALVFTEEGFYDTMAVPPGDHQIVFSYNLDIQSKAMDISKKISIPTDSFVLFPQTGPGTIEGLGEPAGEVAMGDGVEAEFFNKTDLAAGAEISFRIVGLTVNKGNRNSWIIVAVVFAAMTILALIKLGSAGQTEAAGEA